MAKKMNPGLMVVISMVLVMAGAVRADLAAGLVGSWAFDEGSGGTAYDAVGGNDGTIYGATWTTGLSGDGALDFDGVTDSVELPRNEPVWLPTGDFSVSLWVNSDIDISSAVNEMFFNGDVGWSSTSSRRCGWSVSRRPVDGKIKFYLVIDNSGYELTCDTALQANTWYHIVAVREGVSMTVYLNNAVDGSRACGAGNVDYVGSYSVDDVRIGAYEYSGGQKFETDGIINNVALYGRALSVGEVGELYQDGLPPFIGVYHVDGVSGDDNDDGLTRETAFATIQHGIDEANDFNTVLVWPGVYTEEIDFDGKAITVQSADEPAVLEALDVFGDAVSFYNGEGPDSVLKNFIIRNSDAAAFLAGSSPTLSNLTVVNNNSGIAAYVGSEPDISNCIFYNNTDGDLFQCEAQYSWVEEEIIEPVAYWKLDGDAVDSVGSNDGTINGATTTTGQIGDALSFDGTNDHVVIADSPELGFNGAEPFAISLWFYRTVDSGNVETIITKGYNGDPENHNYAIAIMEDDQIKFIWEYGSGTNQEVYSVVTAVAGQWYHTVAVWDGTNQSIYVDGVLRNTVVASGNPVSSGNRPLIIGYQPAGSSSGGYYFDGIIDEVTIYNSALSAGEIDDIYQAGLAGENIAIGPDILFADAAGGDYRLKSERGRYWPGQGVWVLDGATSAGVDGGDPNDDPAAEPLPNGGRINMGAYGGTAHASMSEWPLRHDGNRDGKVDMIDFSRLVQEWMEVLPWAE